MGNAIGRGRRKRAKIMEVNGETTKVKTPIQAKEITEKHPEGHVLLESEAVKKYGIRARPLDPTQYLQPSRVYFLVELPKPPAPAVEERQVLQGQRRVRSGGIHMTAKDRLDTLMLSRRSVSDLSSVMNKPMNSPVKLRMRLPRSQVERLVRESTDDADAARRILDLCSAAPSTSTKGKEVAAFGLSDHRPPLPPLRPPLPVSDGYKKRVGFLPVTDDEIRLAVPS